MKVKRAPGSRTLEFSELETTVDNWVHGLPSRLKVRLSLIDPNNGRGAISIDNVVIPTIIAAVESVNNNH